ncbi:MAG TPA: mechanosensitive ion channel domain-containing protein [Burkholderiales bacterium]|jgi:small-conductance mechanosensitive channel|nr:mechanosensitive ion channel domain-containing protein [Burkholderiales bacterium]
MAAKQTEVGRLISDLLDDLQQGVILWQLVVLAVSLAGGWFFARRVQRRLIRNLAKDPEATVRISVGGISRAALPVTALALLVLGRWILHYFQPVHLLNVAVPLLAALVIIRALVYLLRHTFAPGGLLRSWEMIITWLVWLAVALHITGLLPQLVAFLETTGFTLGKQHVSFMLVLQALFTVALLLLGALWIGKLIEARIMALSHVEVNLRLAMSKIVRTAMAIVAVLIALPLVGIDITALSVFGGALGVGIGLGLQKVAANYMAGFTILLDRSVSPGDLITVDGFYGEVTQLTSRCIVVRGTDGTEAIIPNETLVTSTVINHSYSNRRVLMRLPVQIGYSSDLKKALELMLHAAQSHPRVLRDPAPAALVAGFGADGVNLELMAWIEDPERGKMNLQSDLYLALHEAFRAGGIEIPYPQRDIRILNPVQIDSTGARTR